MSNSLAVATVTAALRNLLFAGVNEELAGTVVTTRPPDRARVNSAGNQVNLFLYQTAIDAAWRNQDMPGKVKPGEVGTPPLPLTLHYLVTAYSDGDDDLTSHRLFGRAMSLLHDHPRLEREELRVAVPGTDLNEQVERVHVTPESMSVEELSKLWTTFQTPLRISAAFRAGVVLIESTTPVRSALPVLARGEGDRGPAAVAASQPIVDEVVFEGGQPGARPGGRFTLRGRNLAGDAVVVRLTHPRIAAPIDVAPASASGTEVAVDLATVAAPMPAGTYALTVLVGSGGRTLTAGPIAIGLAPAVTGGLPADVARANGVATVDLEVEPPLLPDQDAFLLIGGGVVRGTATAPGAVTFAVPGLTVRDYFVRVRVDGADSFLVDLAGPTPAYDATQKVTVTA